MKTYKWESAHGCIIGYLNCCEDDYEEILSKSGLNAVFFSRLAQDITPDESDEEYFLCVKELAIKNKVSMAHRRGGKSDLGIHKKPEGDFERSCAMWGTPGWMGPTA